MYEARGDIPGVCFDENGKKKWLSVLVRNDGEELNVEDLTRCRRIVYYEARVVPTSP